MDTQPLAHLIDYDLNDGVTIMSRCFTPDTCGQEQEIADYAFVPPEEYNTPPKAGDPDVVALREQFANPYKAGPKGEQIAFTVVNEGAATDEVTGLFMNWGRCRDESTVREIAGLVRMNPGMRLVVSDHPGTGQSDLLPAAAAREVAVSGRHTAFAEIVLGGLRSVLEHDKTTLRGRSEGGLVALEVAAQLGKPVQDISVFDSPGSRELRIGESTGRPFRETIARLRGMGHYFARNEAHHAQAYAEVPCFDAEAARLRSEGMSKLEVAKAIAELALERKLMTQLIWLPLGMSQAKLGEAVEVAMTNVKGTMTYISPMFSELNHPGDVARLFQSAVESAASTPRVVRQLIINGTHAFGTSVPDALSVVENYGLYGTAVHEHAPAA